MKRFVLVAALAVAILVGSAVPAFAVTGALGRVRDISSGAVLGGATVSFGTLRAKSGATGWVTLKIKPGYYTFTITRPGYLRTFQNVRVGASGLSRMNWALTRSYPTNAVPNRTVSILAWNDLGMHCDQDSYKYFMLLPPYNTVHAQVFGGGEDGGGGNYSVSYAFAKKKDSTLHTDFWTYAANFGWNLQPNIGLTGNGLSGAMARDSKGLGYVATGIPVTPYDDDGTWDPFGAATITVKSGSTVVGTTNVVVPVSTELYCSNCHGTQNTFQDILSKHDAANSTTLLADANAGHPHSCSECHSDNALGAAGVQGVESLSLAMHNKHKTFVANTTAGCYNCHPGPKTQCLRGIMARAGKGCVDCHGSMAYVASTIVAGRKPWLNEPKCGTCHGAKHAENASTLYRNSVLNNAVTGDMNGRIYCEACHNSTHAELVSRNAADASVAKTAQGNGYWIYNCAVCHKGGDGETAWRGQAMHR